MLLMILMMKKMLKYFTETNCKKANQEEFRTEKVITRKDNKLYVTWKGYDNSLNSWIDKKDRVSIGNISHKSRFEKCNSC